eukprot:scaffold6674_cov18-Prasinocladus_malaysianus.AAC.2
MNNVNKQRYTENILTLRAPTTSIDTIFTETEYHNRQHATMTPCRHLTLPGNVCVPHFSTIAMRVDGDDFNAAACRGSKAI